MSVNRGAKSLAVTQREGPILAKMAAAFCVSESLFMSVCVNVVEIQHLLYTLPSFTAFFKLFWDI